MAAPLAIGAIIGGLKVALKAALTKTGKKIVASELAKDATTIKGAQNIAKLAQGTLSDSQAAILNRLKTKPTAALYKLAAKETGIPQSQLKEVIKAFNQTPKQRQLAVGNQFKQFLQRGLEKEVKKRARPVLRVLNLKKKFTIRELERAAQEYAGNYIERVPEAQAETITSQELRNRNIRNILQAIERETERKLLGISGSQDQNHRPFDIHIDLMKYYKPNIEYPDSTLDILQDQLELLNDDLEYYLTGAGDDIYLVEIRKGVWSKYTKVSAYKFLADIEKGVQAALYVKE